MVALPSKVGYGRVTGQFLSAVIDINTDSDENPEGVYLGGTAIFKPAAQSIIDAYDKAIILPKPVIATIDAAHSGKIWSPDSTEGISLISTDSAFLNPINFTWNVSFQFSDPDVHLSGFDFQLATGQTLDLTSAIPLDSSPGTLTLKGDTGSYQGFENMVDLGNKSGAFNIDLTAIAAATCFKFTLTGNAVGTFIHPPGAGKVASALLRITQGGVGGYTFDITNSRGGFGSDSFNNLSTAVGAIDKWGCESWDNGATWECAPIMQGIG